jgi:hypothetical protein
VVLHVSTAADSSLAAAVALARPQVATPEHFSLSFAGLSAALVELPDLELGTLALDLAVLLSGQKLLPAQRDVRRELAAALRGYEDHLLARLVSDRRWLHLEEAWLAAPVSARPAAAGLLVERLIRRLNVPQHGRLSQAAVRRVASRVPHEVAEDGANVLASDDALAARLHEQLTLAARAARRERALLSDAEVFLLENVATLEGLAARVAMAHLAEAAQAVEEQLPARMKPPAHRSGDAPTSLEEESALPVGGWSSLTTSGSPESLVTSELIYMEEEGAERPDLFDVRFVESELLYYARDESVALRRHRTLCLVLDASLDAARLLDEGEKHQRLVWALAATVAVVRKLSGWLSHEALSFEFVFVRGAHAHPLQAEQGVVGLLLREWQERGRLTFSEAGSVEAVLQRLADEHGPRADVVVLSTKDTALPQGRALKLAAVNVATAPVLSFAGVRLSSTAFGEGPAVKRWGQLTHALLAGLLS